MAKPKKPKTKPIEQYDHVDKERVNNPPVGLVTPETDKDTGKRSYAYDPHLDPLLQWAGKTERTSFEVPIVSLHVHERVDPRTIIEAVRKKNGGQDQMSLFESAGENPPLREAIEFYKHPHGWSNRLMAGDSLLVMNSLLEKEGMAGQVQVVYIDPPYGIKYGSNFQPFVNKRDVRDGKDEDLTAEPEMIKAFRDTWELGIHSYLTYLRDRLLLARELLTESGSVFVQISHENVHHVREILDEVFGATNYVSLISYVTTSGFMATTLARTGDYILWYAKEYQKVKYRRLFVEKDISAERGIYRWLMFPDGSYRGMTAREMRGEDDIPADAKLYRPDNLVSQGASNETQVFKFKGKEYRPPVGSHFKTNISGLTVLGKEGRIHIARNSIQYVRYVDDFPLKPITNIWADTATGNFTEDKIYVVQTASKVIGRCMLMTTDPGDLVFDPTCGSGTTAFVAEQWGRRWITCDTSRVAIALAKQRLMTSLYSYYELAHQDEGVSSGFHYQTVPHVTLKSIATKEPPTEETLYDQPDIDNSKIRVSGPFTIEAVPAPVVRPMSSVGEPYLGSDGDIVSERLEAGDDSSIARSGETLRQAEWRDELLKAGIRAKNNQYVKFSRVEPLPGTKWLHADAETTTGSEDELVAEGVEPYEGQIRAVLSFGPEHAPLEQRQVSLAIEEAQKLVPRPKLVVFAAFQFDPEAAKDIDETEWPGVALLRVQMNADLLTDDLKKKRSSNESFWLMGQPDVLMEKLEEGDDVGKYQVEVQGFDYYNPRTGVVDSGGSDKIAMWMLDTDYDGRSLFPRQVFFPMAGDKEGWARLAKSLKAEIDEELIEAYRGTVSLPFERGKNGRVAVKIVDDRGIESLKIVDLD